MLLIKNLFLLLALLISGCIGNTKWEEFQAELGLLWDGKKLVTNQPIVVPGGRSRIWFVGGSQVDNIKRFKPTCQLEVNPLRPESWEIPADVYPVQSIQYGTRAFGGPSGSENRLHKITISLQDGRGNMRSLICGDERWSRAWITPTPEQINQILGETLNFR